MENLIEIFIQQRQAARANYTYFHLGERFLEYDPGEYYDIGGNEITQYLYREAIGVIGHIIYSNDNYPGIWYKLKAFDDILWEIAPERPLKTNRDTIVQSIVKNRFRYSHLIDETYTWDVYLAVLALSFLEEHDCIYPFLETEYSELDMKERTARYATLANEALNAIWFIEYLDNLNIKPTVSENSSRAVKIKNLPKLKIKKQFIDFYYKKRHTHKISGAEAARQFYAQLSNTDRGIICFTPTEEKAVRTLTRYLAKEKKQMRYARMHV